MATSLQKRALDRLLRSLGQDVNLAEQPAIDPSRISLVAQVDNLEYAHAGGGKGRLLVTFIPSSGAVTFCGWELTARLGFFIRELVTAGANTRFYLTGGGGPVGNFVVADPLTAIPIVCGRPEDTDYPGFTLSNIGDLTTGTNAPRVFTAAQSGQAPIQPGTGPFLAAGVVLRDIYVPAGFTFAVIATTVNIPYTTYVQIDLTAENFFT